MFTIKIRGASHIAFRLVASYFVLHLGHKYLLSFVSLSILQKSVKASCMFLPLTIGKLRVKISSNVSDL